MFDAVTSWRRRGASLLLIGTAAAVVVSSCDPDFIFSGNATPTAVSGTSTGNVHTLSVSGGRYGVESIEWAEGGITGGLDRPCFLRVGFRSLNQLINENDAPDTVEDFVNVCNASSYNASTLMKAQLRFSRESYATGNLESWHLFASSVQTCDSGSSNDRIKGVSLWGSAQNGSAVPEPTDYECLSGPPYVRGPCRDHEVRRALVERTNCSSWNSLVACPAGQIASGVKVHVANGNEIVGLALECDTVVTAQSP